MVTWQKKSYISTFTRPIDRNLAGRGKLTYKVTWHINHVVTRQIKNNISLLSQGLWTPNLANCWLRMRGRHPQSHVTLQYRGHVTTRKHYISTFTRLMDPKFSWVVTYDERTSPTKSRGSSITWSCVKSKRFISTFTKPTAHKTC